MGDLITKYGHSIQGLKSSCRGISNTGKSYLLAIQFQTADGSSRCDMKHVGSQDV